MLIKNSSKFIQWSVQCNVTCHSYIHTNGKKTIATTLTEETDLINILRSESWEKRLSYSASDFPTKCLKILSREYVYPFVPLELHPLCNSSQTIDDIQRNDLNSWCFLRLSTKVAWQSLLDICNFYGLIIDNDRRSRSVTVADKLEQTKTKLKRLNSDANWRQLDEGVVTYDRCLHFYIKWSLIYDTNKNWIIYLNIE